MLHMLSSTKILTTNWPFETKPQKIRPTDITRYTVIMVAGSRPILAFYRSWLDLFIIVSV